MEVGNGIKDLKEPELIELRDLIQQFLEKKRTPEIHRIPEANLTPPLSSVVSMTPPEGGDFDSSNLSGPLPRKATRSPQAPNAVWSPPSTTASDGLIPSDEVLRRHFIEAGRSHSGSSISSVDHVSQCWAPSLGPSSATATIQLAATAAGAAPSVVDQFASTQGAAFVRCGSSVSSRGSPSPTPTHSPTLERVQEAHLCDDPSATQRNQLFKTELCRTFMETGRCRYGGKCQFAHGHPELRPVKRHPKYKTKVCRNFADTGSCPYGSRCRFIHGPSAPTPDLDDDLLGAVQGLRVGFLGDDIHEDTHRGLPIYQLLQGLSSSGGQRPVGTNLFSRAPGTASSLDSGW